MFSNILYQMFNEGILLKQSKMLNRYKRCYEKLPLNDHLLKFTQQKPQVIIEYRHQKPFFILNIKGRIFKNEKKSIYQNTDRLLIASLFSENYTQESWLIGLSLYKNSFLAKNHPDIFSGNSFNDSCYESVLRLIVFLPSSEH